MFSKKQPQTVLIPIPVERTRTEYVDRHVTINRAPTDDSVKLLREMEQKAEAEVVKAVQVGNATFECVVHQHRDAMSDRMCWRSIFKLNGKQMTAKIDTDPRSDNMRDAFSKLRDEMAKAIAEEVLNDAFVALMRERFAR